MTLRRPSTTGSEEPPHDPSPADREPVPGDPADGPRTSEQHHEPGHGQNDVARIGAVHFATIQAVKTTVGIRIATHTQSIDIRPPMGLPDGAELQGGNEGSPEPHGRPI